MKTQLNDYATFVKELLAKNGADEKELERYSKLALDADEHPYYSRDPNQKGKDWATLEFMGTPTPAGLATISDYQNKVIVISFDTPERILSDSGSSVCFEVEVGRRVSVGFAGRR